MNADNKGRIIGFSIGSVLNPISGCIIFGAVIILVGIAILIGNLSSIAAGNAVYTNEGDLWGQDPNAKILEINEGSRVVEFDYTAGTLTAGIPGSPPDTLYVYYDVDDPSQVRVFGRVTPAADRIRTRGRVVETRKDSYTLEYNITEKRAAALPGKPRDRDSVGRTVHIYYEKANPSNITEEVYKFMDFAVFSGFPLLFGGIFIFIGLWVRRSVKKNDIQNKR